MKENTIFTFDKLDWDVGKKIIDISSWKGQSIGGLQVSPDGENLAAVKRINNGYFQVKDILKIWDSYQFDKIWNFRFGENGTSYACVSTENGWTLAINGKKWKKDYDYIWNLLYTHSGKKYSIAASIRNDMNYCMVLNEKIWPKNFAAITYTALSQDGSKTAAVVQTEAHKFGEIHKFRKNIYTVSVDGKTWKNRFMNAWNISISPDSHSVAVEVRLDSNNYSIATNDVLWPKTYDCIWKPIFHPKNKTVVAPIKIGNQWGMAIDGFVNWKAKFCQLWHQQYDPKGINLAAIVSPQYGRWTIAVNEIVWKTMVDTMITNLTFSQDGKRLAVLAKHKNFWTIILDDTLWNYKFDMIWPPVFSLNGENIAAKVKIDDKYTFVINGKLYGSFFDEAWDPKFNLQGDKLLLRTIKKNKYKRQVILVN